MGEIRLEGPKMAEGEPGSEELADDSAEPDEEPRVEPDEERSEQEELPPELEDLEDQADAAADFIDELLVQMGIDAIAEPTARGQHMYVDIVDGPDEDMALLIGRNGQTLEAIQELTRMVVGRKLDERVRVIVDVQDYRKQRESQLEERARELAERVLDTGQEEELEPMNSFERKLVHDAAAEVAGVGSVSRGEEPNRYVVIHRL
jgi:spoIIIJ-associated protein